MLLLLIKQDYSLIDTSSHCILDVCLIINSVKLYLEDISLLMKKEDIIMRKSKEEDNLKTMFTELSDNELEYVTGGMTISQDSLRSSYLTTSLNPLTDRNGKSLDIENID